MSSLRSMTGEHKVTAQINFYCCRNEVHKLFGCGGKKEQWINACMKNSPLTHTSIHAHLCSLFLFIILPPYISRAPSLTLVQSRMASPPTTRIHTCVHARTHTHTPPRHLSVQRPVSLALGAVGSKRVKEKVYLGSIVLNPTSSLLSPAVLLSIKWSHNITLSASGPSLLL